LKVEVLGFDLDFWSCDVPIGLSSPGIFTPISHAGVFLDQFKIRKLFDSKGQSWSYFLVLPRKHEILFRPRLIDQKRNSGSIMAKGAKNNLYNRFTREVTETAEGMRSIGAMDKEAHNLTPRDLSRGPRS
jgi:hypothetical protein